MWFRFCWLMGAENPIAVAVVPVVYPVVGLIPTKSRESDRWLACASRIILRVIPVVASVMLGFDRETTLDLVVNVIPLAIILFFMILFAVVQQWPFDPFLFVVTQGLLIVPLVLLGLLTYVAGRVISRDQAGAD